MQNRPADEPEQLWKDQPGIIDAIAESLRATANFETVRVQWYNGGHINVGNDYPEFLRSDKPYTVQVMSGDKTTLLEIRELIWTAIYAENTRLHIFKDKLIGKKMTPSLIGLLENLAIQVSDVSTKYTLTW